jgi:DNA polymerase III delta prime subunit
MYFIHKALSGDIPHLLFWGEFGTGKTTVADIIARKLLGNHLNNNFIELMQAITEA